MGADVGVGVGVAVGVGEGVAVGTDVGVGSAAQPPMITLTPTAPATSNETSFSSPLSPTCARTRAGGAGRGRGRRPGRSRSKLRGPRSRSEPLRPLERLPTSSGERFSSTARRERLTRPMRSISTTITSSSSPTLTAASTDSTRLVSSSLTCTMPSLPGRISTNAPKFISRVTWPVYRSPTSTSFVSPSIMRMACSAAAASDAPMVTTPSFSTSTDAPVVSTMLRIVLPPGPMSAPILSTGMLTRVMARRVGVQLRPRLSERAEHVVEDEGSPRPSPARAPAGISPA